MNEIYFRELLEQYITGQISEPDQKYLLNLLEQEQYRNILRRILRKEWNEGIYEEQGHPQIASLIERYVITRIKDSNHTPLSFIPFLRRYRSAAAAVILLIVGATLFFVYRTSNGNTNVTAGTTGHPAKTIDIPAGTNGAVLTLADGSKVLLDNSGNGVITHQGSTKIVKLSNGQLAYQVTGTKGAVFYNTLTTDPGKQFHVKLPDGTDVWLNAASSLRYPTVFNGKERKVEVTGEAYFEISANVRMPFIVSTREQDITVLGTRFNVNSYQDENFIRTTLSEGSVKITMRQGDKSTVIRPGEQSVVADNNIKIQEVNVSDVIAWKNGFFSFRQTDIKGIIRQLSRWYDMQVKYEGVDPTETFTGKIDRNLKLNEVLKILEQTSVHFKIEEGRKLVILP